MSTKVKKNYFYNLFYQLLLVIVPVITTPYISRVLGSEKIGVYNFTTSIVAYFTLIGSLGVGLYGAREIAKVQDNVKKRTTTFWQINFIKWIAIALSLIVYFIACVPNETYSPIYAILTLEIISSAFDISWYFQGLENFKTITIRNTIVKIVSVIAIFAFVKSPDDLWLYTLICVLSSLLGNLSLWFVLPRHINKARPAVKNIKKHFLPIFLMFLPQIAIQVYTVLDKTMLGLLVEDISETGIYGQSQKIIKIALTLVTSLGAVMAPHIANLFANKNKDKVIDELKKSFHLVWYLALPLCLGIIAITPNFVPWFFGDEFLGTIPVMQIGALLILSIGLNNVTGMQYLIPIRKENLFTISVVIGAVANFIGNLILIPHLGAVGAIISSVAAETIIFVVQLFMIKRRSLSKTILSDLLKPLISAAAMFTVALILNNTLTPSIPHTAIIAIAGAATYLIMTFILKESWTMKYLRTITNKLRRKK